MLVIDAFLSGVLSSTQGDGVDETGKGKLVSKRRTQERPEYNPDDDVIRDRVSDGELGGRSTAGSIYACSWQRQTERSLID
jgi:hypothetical protein